MNFYEFIGISPSASPDEADVALTAKYNEVRRLVTHHDPNISMQANLDLQRIEQARAILLDSERRIAYDASIGLRAATSGLADPEAILQKYTTGTVTPPTVSSPARTAQQMISTNSERTDAWICPSCRTANPTQTRFCKSCGTEIGTICPNCQSLVESIATFCQKCGVNVHEAQERVEQNKRQQAILVAEQQRREAERLALLEPIVQSANRAWDMTKIGCILSFIPPLNIASLVLWGIGIVNARKTLARAQFPGDDTYRAKAKKAFWWSVIPLGLTIAGLVMYLLTLILSYLTMYLTQQGY